MKQSTVRFLGIATVLVAVGAVVAGQFRASGTRASGTDEPLLPVLEERVNDVASVAIETQDGPITLTRDGERWTLAEKAGYAANDSKVRELILALRSATLVEEKTSNVERFDKLGLEAPDAEGSSSKRVTLKDAKGVVIASALIGDRRFGKGGFNQSPGAVRPEDQYYVVPKEGGPAFLAAGKLQVEARQVGWVEQQFFDLARDRIRAARVTQPDGGVLEVARADMEADELDVLTIPAGKEPKTPSGTRPFLDALARMRFDDVKKVDALDWTKVTKAEFFTEHGIRVTVESVQVPKDGAPAGAEAAAAVPQMTTWARFTVDVAPEAAPVIPAVPDVPEVTVSEEPAEDGSTEPDDGDTEEPAPAAPSVAELQREARELGESLQGWAYALPSWKTTALRMPIDTLVQDIPPPPEPEPEPEQAPDQQAPVDAPLEEAASGSETGGGL